MVLAGPRPRPGPAAAGKSGSWQNSWSPGGGGALRTNTRPVRGRLQRSEQERKDPEAGGHPGRIWALHPTRLSGASFFFSAGTRRSPPGRVACYRLPPVSSAAFAAVPSEPPGPAPLLLRSLHRGRGVLVTAKFGPDAPSVKRKVPHTHSGSGGRSGSGPRTFACIEPSPCTSRTSTMRMAPPGSPAFVRAASIRAPAWHPWEKLPGSDLAAKSLEMAATCAAPRQVR